MVEPFNTLNTPLDFTIICHSPSYEQFMHNVTFISVRFPPASITRFPSKTITSSRLTSVPVTTQSSGLGDSGLTSGLIPAPLHPNGGRDVGVICTEWALKASSQAEGLSEAETAHTGLNSISRSINAIKALRAPPPTPPATAVSTAVSSI